MRLLYFLNSITNSGGMERIVIDKINYLVGLDGYEVVLAFFGTMEDKPFFSMDERIRLYPIREQKLGNSLMEKFVGFLRLPRKVKCLIDEVKPNIIVNANTILVSWLLPFIRKSIPKIVELHFSYVGMKIISEEMYGRNWLKKEFNYRLRKWGYPKYDRCVLLTNDDSRDWHFKNAVVIPNFTNIKPSEYHQSEKRRTVVNVGRLSPPKNQKVLVEAWDIVNKRYPDWELEIWGNGELHDDLVKQIADLGLEEKVRLMGVSHHIEEVYRYASFFVLSSSYEGQPLVMIEALQSSLPCVCFAINGVRSTIKNGENGYIIEKMTAEALADGILKMIEYQDEIPAMAQRAKESAKVFEKERIMARWTTLFEELTQKDKQNG